jgi:hypothetical protein
MSFEPPELRPVWASHSRAVLSSEPVRTCRPSGLKATELDHSEPRASMSFEPPELLAGLGVPQPGQSRSLSGPAGRPD